MKNDVLIAIIIGFITGGVFALTAVSLPSLIQNIQRNQSASPVIPSITPVVAKLDQEALLTIENPVNNSISSSQEIQIRGKSIQGNTIVVDGETDTKAVEVDNSQSFSLPLILVEGANTIIITAYTQQGQSTNKSYTIFYTSEEL